MNEANTGSAAERMRRHRKRRRNGFIFNSSLTLPPFQGYSGL
jgi:hypothetical protein